MESILRTMAQEPPIMVSRDKLRRLAELSLCKEVHHGNRNQQMRSFEDLEVRLRRACDDYRQFRTLQEQNTEQGARIQLLDDQYKKIHGDLKTSRDETTKRMAEFENQRKWAQTLSGQLSSSTAELGNANFRIAALKTIVEGLEESKSSLQSKLTDLGEQSDKQNKTISSLHYEYRAFKHQHQTTKAEISRHLLQS